MFARVTGLLLRCLLMIFYLLVHFSLRTSEYKETDWVKNGERVKVRRFPTKKPGSGIRYRLKQKQNQRYITDVIILFLVFKNKIIVIPIAWLSGNFSLLSCFHSLNSLTARQIFYFNVDTYNPFSISLNLVLCRSEIEFYLYFQAIQ